MTMMTNTSKGTALITGGARRVGRGLALALAADGYDIALHYNTSRDEAEATAAEICSHNVRCELIAADLRSHADVAGLVPQVDATLGNLAVLINNASIFNRVSFVDSDEANFDDNFHVHVKAPYFLSQAFARVAKAGHIINISDTYVRSNEGAYFAYLLSKKSLTDLTGMLAEALAPDIQVSAIALGMTEFNDNLDPDYVQARIETLPIPEVITIEQIQQTIRNILAKHSTTERVIFLDNGAHLL